MKRKLVILSIAVLCMSAVPAKADLFSFTYTSLETWFDGTSAFVSDEVAGSSTGTVTNLQGGGTAIFDTAWGAPDDYTLSMTISNIGGGGTTADGAGTFTLTDVDSDTITGSFTGAWAPSTTGGALSFDGVMNSVEFLGQGDGDNTAFNGDFLGSAPMPFPGSGTWGGSILHLVLTGLDFNTAWGDGSPGDGAGGIQDGGMTAVVVPVPAAILLGMLGLSVAGLKLRKHA